VSAQAEAVLEKISKTLLSWASVLEDNTREQAVRTASMPSRNQPCAARCRA
jgi:hypothetical protein